MDEEWLLSTKGTSPNSLEDEAQFSPETGAVIGGSCQAQEAKPKYLPPLFEEREV